MRKKVLSDDYFGKIKKHLETIQALISSIVPILEPDILNSLGENGNGLIKIMVNAAATKIEEVKKITEV